MNNEKVLAIDRSKINSLIQFVFLIVIATVVPLFHQQMITGPIVNATLFIATALLGVQMGIMVGLIPSVIAISVGTLPLALASMVPYIMVSNAVLILTFNSLKNKSYWLAVVLSSFLKFLFLYGTSSLVVNLLLKKELAGNVALMMGYPQFITALAGGVLANLFLVVIRKSFVK